MLTNRLLPPLLLHRPSAAGDALFYPAGWNPNRHPDSYRFEYSRSEVPMKALFAALLPLLLVACATTADAPVVATPIQAVPGAG